MKAYQHQKGDWCMHQGKRVPYVVKDNVRIEVEYRDGSRRISDDWMHDDLWKPETVGEKWNSRGNAKDIMMFRLL